MVICDLVKCMAVMAVMCMEVFFECASGLTDGTIGADGFDLEDLSSEGSGAHGLPRPFGGFGDWHRFGAHGHW